MIETRQSFIERILRAVYGTQPSDDSAITVNLVNKWLGDAVAVAAKQNYQENLKIDNIGCVNNSFYTTFSDISIVSETATGYFTATLPDIPLGLGATEGISTAQVVSSNGRQSRPVVLLNTSQVNYFDRMVRTNKVFGFSENKFFKLFCPQVNLANFTLKLRMVSSGDGSDLTSTISVPSDYFPVIVEYVKQQLVFERAQPKDTQNDGVDN